MADQPKFRRTRISFDVLSEEPIHPHLDIEYIVRECDTGDYVMGTVERTDEPLTPQEMVRALRDAGSEPGFFMLDDAGNPTED